jgi:hypothetical protein
MSETPEQKQASDKVDDMIDEAGWREERKASWWRWGALGSRWYRWKLDPPPGSRGLRDALHEDDEKS